MRNKFKNKEQAMQFVCEQWPKMFEQYVGNGVTVTDHDIEERSRHSFIASCWFKVHNKFGDYISLCIHIRTKPSLLLGYYFYVDFIKIYSPHVEELSGPAKIVERPFLKGDDLENFLTGGLFDMIRMALDFRYEEQNVRRIETLAKHHPTAKKRAEAIEFRSELIQTKRRWATMFT